MVELNKNKIKGLNGEFRDSLTLNNYTFSFFEENEKKRVGCFFE